ncbi:MAG: D-2-hydroxyacid dehydrogenase [Lachnospiraceae bacterium]
MKIVLLDTKTIGEDIDFSGFEALGEVIRYDYVPEEQMPEKIQDADVIVVNKLKVNEATIGSAERLKLVCVTATGTDNLDKEYLEKRGIAFRNVAGYSTNSVAQHTFAMLFYLWEKLPYYDAYVKTEQYCKDNTFSHFSNVFHELSGKTWGIIGLGTIGKKVAEIASAFGCRVVYYSASGKNHNTQYPQVTLDELLQQADVVSVHAPLNEYTKGLMNKEAFCKMKKTAIFLNLGRGPIVVEKDLADCLQEGIIAAAGLDVLSQEPMQKENPLLAQKDSQRLLITPHIAWASKEARNRVVSMVCEQIKEFVL